MKNTPVNKCFFWKIFFALCFLFTNQLSAVSSNFNWMELFPADSPAARLSAQMAFDPVNNQVVLQGGGFSSFRFGDTWIWNGFDWIEKFPTTSPTPPRSAGVMYYDPATNKVLLFGGISNSFTPLNDTWVWDGTNWTQLFPTTSPPARFLAAMAPDSNTGQLLLFGGTTNDNFNLNDTWVWDGTLNTWIELFPAHSPLARDSAAMVFNPTTSQLILFGGIISSAFANDTWLWNGTDWIQQFPTSNPSPRGSPSMAFDPISSQLLLFGGLANPGGFLNDSWLWDGSNWNQQLTVISPPGREQASMVNDSIGHPFLFGGVQVSPLLNDTWIWVPLPHINPAFGPELGGTIVTITGSFFTGATAVHFGTTAASFLIDSDTQITAVSPSGTGKVHVTVTTPNGTSVTAPADEFTYIPAPTVLSIAPFQGPEGGGISVSITGTNFTGATSVRFGPTSTSFIVNNESSITAISPSGTGIVDVTVTRLNGTSAITAADRFTYIPAPAVTSINPNQGPQSGGTSVTINGVNFAGATGVKFGSVPAAFTVISGSQITAILPLGTGVVDVTVATPNGTSPITSADRFAYKQSASIALFASPNPTSVDEPVTLTATVTPGSATGTVTFFDQATILVTVPVVNGQAVFITSSLAAGTHSLIAVYNGDANFFPATSPAITLFVNGVLPPLDLKGFQRANRFVTQTDYINTLTWEAPTQGTPPVEYKIYLDSSLQKEIAVVFNHHRLRFEDHNRKKGKTYTYFIVSVDRKGNISFPASVTIKDER